MRCVRSERAQCFGDARLHQDRLQTREATGELWAQDTRELIEMIERVHENAKARAQIAMAQEFAQVRATRGAEGALRTRFGVEAWARVLLQ